MVFLGGLGLGAWGLGIGGWGWGIGMFADIGSLILQLLAF
jgi:hypothetical protein